MEDQSKQEELESEGIDEDLENDDEDDHERAFRLLGEKWVAEDQCRWTIFEDLEDELAHHRRRSRALCCFVRAYGELREEYDNLQEGGLQLQDAYEQLQDELREAVGDAAYWKELAEARAEMNGTTLVGPPRPAVTEAVAVEELEAENEDEQKGVDDRASVEASDENVTSSGETQNDASEECSSQKGNHADADDEIGHVDKECLSEREVLHGEMLKDAQQQAKKYRKMYEEKDEELRRLRRHLERLDQQNGGSPSSPRVDSVERGGGVTAASRLRPGLFTASSIAGLTASRGLSPFARASAQTPPRCRSSAVGLSEQQGNQRQAWQGDLRTPKSPAITSTQFSPARARDCRSPACEADEDSSRFPCAAVAGLAASGPPAQNAQTSRRILFSASSPSGSQSSFQATSTNKPEQAQATSAPSTSSLPVRAVPTPSRGMLGLGNRPALKLGTPSRRKEAKQESCMEPSDHQRLSGSPPAVDSTSHAMEPSRASLASRSRPSMSPAKAGRASISGTRRLTVGLGQPTRRSTIPGPRTSTATAREDSPRDTCLTPPRTGSPTAPVPFQSRSSGFIGGSAYASETSVGSQEASVGETSVGSQDSVGMPRRGVSELFNSWDAKRNGAEAKRPSQYLNPKDRRGSTASRGALCA